MKKFFTTMGQDLATSQGDIGRLLSAIFIDGLVVGMVLTHIPLTLQHAGQSSQVIGWVLGSTSLAALPASPLVGVAGRKFGMARAVIAAGFANIILIILMSLWQDPIYWGVVRFVAGFSVMMRWLGMEAWVNSLATIANRGRIMTLYTASYTSAVAIGSGVIGHIFLLGFWPYGIMAGLLCLSSLPILTMKHKTIKSPPRGAAAGAPMGLVAGLKTNPLVAAVAVISGVMFGASGMISVQMINHGFTAAEASFFIFLYFIGPIILFPLISAAVNDISARTLIPLAGLVAAVAAWPAFYTDRYWVIAIFIIIYGATELIIYSSLLGFIGHHYRGHQLVTMNSLVVMIYNATSMITAPVAGVAMAAFGLLGLPLLMMTIGLLAIGIMIIGKDQDKASP